LSDLYNLFICILNEENVYEAKYYKSVRCLNNFIKQAILVANDEVAFIYQRMAEMIYGYHKKRETCC